MPSAGGRVHARALGLAGEDDRARGGDPAAHGERHDGFHQRDAAESETSGHGLCSFALHERPHPTR